RPGGRPEVLRRRMAAPASRGPPCRPRGGRADGVHLYHRTGHLLHGGVDCVGGNVICRTGLQSRPTVRFLPNAGGKVVTMAQVLRSIRFCYYSFRCLTRVLPGTKGAVLMKAIQPGMNVALSPISCEVSLAW